jgi:MFS transporter, DHA1 family, multidrug resistance protein
MPFFSRILQRRPQPGFVEFVTLMGLMMALISLSIDNLLPAFPAIQASFAVTDPDTLQYVLSAYMAGFGLMQLVYGLASDVLGRRPTLMMGQALFCVGTVLAVWANSFEWLLIARAMQGMGAAAARVMTDAIIRDRFVGGEMARTASFTMMIFIIVQVIAPLTGQWTLLAGSWRLIFVTMLLLALAQMIWFHLRMPETLAPEYRLPYSFQRIREGVRMCLRTRTFSGYTMAIGLLQGTLLAYLGSCQEIFGRELYDLGSLFPLAFGAIAAVMGLASVLNAGLVRRLGLRRLAHAGICSFVVIALFQLLLAFSTQGRPALLPFASTLAAIMFVFSLTAPNFSAIAMEPLGAVAGTGSSLMGSYINLAATVLGAWIGQAFDGTVLPLCFGFFVLGSTSLLLVLWTERGHLFAPHPPDGSALQAASYQQGNEIG